MPAVFCHFYGDHTIALDKQHQRLNAEINAPEIRLVGVEGEQLGIVSLAEALGKAGGLLDERADATAIYVMRYEPAELVHALGQPAAARAPAGLSPVVYRLDLFDAKSYLLAKRFPVRDKDIIFVAEAKTVPITRALQTLARITGPVSSAVLICQSTNKC